MTATTPPPPSVSAPSRPPTLADVGPIGGQALVEGVMMRRAGAWGAAVRRLDGTIATTGQPLPDDNSGRPAHPVRAGPDRPVGVRQPRHPGHALGRQGAGHRRRQGLLQARPRHRLDRRGGARRLAARRGPGRHPQGPGHRRPVGLRPRRGPAAPRCARRLHGPALAQPRGEAHLRLPRGRAHDGARLRARHRPRARGDPPVRPSPPPLRHGLPADRGDRRPRGPRHDRRRLVGGARSPPASSGCRSWPASPTR